MSKLKRFIQLIFVASTSNICALLTFLLLIANQSPCTTSACAMGNLFSASVIFLISLVVFTGLITPLIFWPKTTFYWFLVMTLVLPVLLLSSLLSGLITTILGFLGINPWTINEMLVIILVLTIFALLSFFYNYKIRFSKPKTK